MLSLFDELDPRLGPALREEYRRRTGERADPLPRGVTVVLAGHRAAGKTRLLGPVARLLGRDGVDLDAHLEREAGRPLKEWVAADQPGFRAAERRAFRALPPGLVVAVGGGFLAHHPEALSGTVVVLVPVSFETYVDRLLADESRPRLLPGRPLSEELRAVYFEREELHRRYRPLSVVDFLLRVEAGVRPRRVVTAPEVAHVSSLAWVARHAGADLLEVRTDLTPAATDLREAARALPLLVARRSPEVPSEWRELATVLDEPLEDGGAGPLVSFHAPAPMETDDVLRAWERVPAGTQVKHVEPLGEPGTAQRLWTTRDALRARFGADRVTVLATGAAALPFRAALAEGNALDYLRLDAGWAAAPGQRLIADAVREWRRPARPRQTHRLGIVGSGLAHSMSPRIHRQPFDRIDLPADVDLEPLLAAMVHTHAGLAVTAPFKRRVATMLGRPGDAVNTLVRRGESWEGSNSDVHGARVVLEALGAKTVTVLGDGGVGPALRATAQDVSLEFVTTAGPPRGALSGAVVWTWPPGVPVPAWVRFDGAEVAVIAYGAPGRRIAGEIVARGGRPRLMGRQWFFAQARAQRALWDA